MPTINTAAEAWSLMRDLAAKLGAGSEVSNSDVQKLLQKADKDGNGVITEKEFVDAFENSADFKKFEENYLKAFKLIAGLDGEGATISLSDISETIKAFDELMNTNNDGGDDSPTDPTPPKDDSLNDIDVKPVGDLSGKELSVLQSERSGVMSQIDTMRSEKTTATAEAQKQVQTAQTAFNEATATFTELVKAKMEKEAETNEQAKQVLLLEDTKNALNTEITNQKTAISTATTTVSTIKSSISSLVVPPETISYVDEETKETVTERNPEYDAYLVKKAALEDELAAAEIDLANKEAALEELEADLTNVENDLTAAIEAYVKSEKDKNTLTKEEEDAYKAIGDNKKAYDEAKVAEKEVSAEYDDAIDTLQENLKAYTDAITQKKFELPENYAVKDGIITNGTDNLQPIAELPNGYTVENGVILDDKKQPVGYATGSDDKQQLYLQKEREPESEMTFSERYIAARTLFDSNEGWSTTDFSQFNSTDLKGIRELYDDMVEKHNESIEAEEEKVANFNASAETNLKDKPEVYAAVSSLIDKTYENVTVSPNTFISSLEKDNVDVAKLTPEELSAKLEEFVVANYGLQYINQYYPSLTNDKLKDYVGEGGVDGLKTADEATVKATIDKIMGDKNLTPYEKIQLLEMVKASSDGTSSHVDKILGADDTFFYTTLEEMTTAKNANNEGLYTPADIIEFIRQYKVVDNKSTVLSKEKLDEKFIAEMVALYEQTTDPTQKLKLEQLIGSDVIIDLLPETGYEDQKASLEQNGFRIEENVSLLLQNLGVDPNCETTIDTDGHIVVKSKEEGIDATYTFDANGRLLSYESPIGKFVQKDGKIVLEHVNQKGEKVTTEFPAGDIESIVKTIQDADAEKLLNTAMTYFAEHPELHRRNYCVVYTQAVLKEFGIDIPGNSYNVYKKTEKIDASQLKPGDLYLSTNYPGSMTDSNEPRHVGIVASVTKNNDGTYTYVTIDFAQSGVTVNVHNTGNKKEDWYEFRRPGTT